MGDQGLYIQMFSIHGLVRSENLELGRDADTGGQVKYVIELANQLSEREEVRQVDLFTRQIKDKKVSEDYGKAIEKINDKFRIARIRCGGLKYIRKELLWPHMDEYVDKTVKFIKKENQVPDIVHGHYADAGYVAMELAKIFGLPLVFTGHSMGRSKFQKLLNDGMTEDDIIKKYKIDHRIAVEEEVIKSADLIITSTNQEIDEQYKQYDNSEIPEYRVIPPGIDIQRFYPYYHDRLPESEKSEIELYSQASVLRELDRFLMYPDKPLVLALSRPDKRKNISGLVQAYGEDQELQTMANLAIFAGIRKDIDKMEENESDVLTRMLLMMDKYDLYGKMAIPKKHDIEYEVPELYRIAAEKRGVFVNPALTEPFGLTLLEASATGLPIVATKDGGPYDIISNCENGILVDPTNPKDITEALKTIITDYERWTQYSKNGIMNVRKYYTWESHAATYMEAVSHIESKADFAAEKERAATPIGKRLACLNRFLITDIDNTLIGESNGHLPELIDLLEENKSKMGFAVATGRTASSARDILGRHNVPMPDIVISSVGTEIYYGSDLRYDRGWETHIANQWDREKIVELLSKFDFLEYQAEDAQRPFKVSYDMDPGKDRLAKVHDVLLKNKCRYTLIYSHEKHLDIIPYRASKGKAIRYLSYKWEIPLNNLIICGDSGNDEEMLRGEPRGVVVGNYSPELDTLKGAKNVYFAKQPCAGGILEAIRKYQFIEKAKKQEC
ncbi:MAG TPA: HAD-IIB family hydrolase [Desulfosalsimonadaceae bacterium]|nr:HAD-IIB family hydrolase [Desulfosalsimonadaceae bacterium]